ncbi:MAG TPA: hypothetical protein PLL54_07540, partial [Dermatophilaceae bacterium]|nr:hypothetical protein [Dermatophilaceae bacterium]
NLTIVNNFVLDPLQERAINVEVGVIHSIATQFEVALKNQGKRGIWFSSWTGSGADAPWNTDEPQPRPTRCPHKFDEPTYVEGAPLHGSTASAHSPLQAARSESGTRHSGLRPGRR